ncbi:hypothetical protein AW168_39900 [Nocardia brasiliensis]|nr:hypothetical protein AW168_39900 [Nocardia brasiliensis]
MRLVHRFDQRLHIDTGFDRVLITMQLRLRGSEALPEQLSPKVAVCIFLGGEECFDCLRAVVLIENGCDPVVDRNDEP